MFTGRIELSTNDGEEFNYFNQAQNSEFEQQRISEVLQVLLNCYRNGKESGLKLFDIGCGAGALLVKARELGIEVSGCEISESAYSICKEDLDLNVFLGLFESLKIREEYDYITLFCVLAHVTDLDIFLSAIHEGLNENGVLYFHTPAFCLIDKIGIGLTSLPKIRYSKLLRRRINREHKRIFTEKSLKLLLVEHGFKVCDIKKTIGYGLSKRHYFLSLGFPRKITIVLEKLLDLAETLHLLPRNVFSVYAQKVS
jgi:2-polyprenyl-3-methyl-5-hydroxy-6-metoxy-1,4-benzoquinol methylase